MPDLLNFTWWSLLYDGWPSAQSVLTMLPASSTLNKQLLTILDKCTHLRHLQQLQSHLIALGHAHDQFFSFKLIRCCTLSLSSLAYARSIFDTLPSPNVYLYTAMITAYSSQNSKFDHHSSLVLYRDLVRKGKPKVSHFIYPHVLKSCPDFMQHRCAEMVHTQIVKTGYGDYPVVQTALVNSYSRFSDGIRVARMMFDEMSDRNVVSWTAMVSGYTRVGEMGQAISLFEKMPERDVPSWNSIIGGCTQNGLYSEGISLFRRMVGEGNRPNQVTVACWLSACGHSSMLQIGKCGHGYILRNGLGPDWFMSNALVDMYGKCGSLIEAKRVFDKTSKRSLTLWNSMIISLALHGQSDCAITVFEEMMRSKDDLKPDGITFIGLLNACTHGGLVEKGRSYFRSMTEDYGIEPQIQHYGCLIDLLGRAGEFNEAMEAINGMRMAPDEVIWGSLLNGCKIHGRTDLAEFAVTKLIEADPNNGGYGIMLANLYGELGKWDEARKVRRTLKEQNSYKMPGCSWIEIDNLVHQFYSADESHPRIEDIYTVLETMFDFSYEVGYNHPRDLNIYTLSI